MAEGRGKKAKKARWQLVLGLKQVLCGALGLTWMMVIIFILGVLAGRGDIYRWLSSWGLITPVPANIAHWSPPPEAPLTAAPVKSPPQGPSVKPAASALPPSAASPRPVTGSIAPASSRASSHTAAPRAKKARRGFSHRDHKAREEELRRLRREVAAKLKFQNSFDSRPSRTARSVKKKKDKAGQGQKAPSRQVRVAQYRNLKAAKARMADLQKKGKKVTLKKGKDKKGAYYEIYREAPAKQTRRVVGLAQKTKKSNGKKTKVRLRN